ncbi:hypothetical protein B5F27_11965 [Faecalibacterium sp. An192]|nr:hypothetical protein B5F27_11965 [Faecalibacterium sp. An192]
MPHSQLVVFKNQGYLNSLQNILIGGIKMGTETALSTETANAFNPNKIAADVTTTLITEAIKSGWQKVKNFFQDSDAKDSIDYGDAYEDYLQNTVDNISQIKTLLSPYTPQFFHTFYECPNVQSQDEIINTSNTQNLLNISNRVIITGAAGLGKTLLLKYLFLDSVENNNYIPVFIELREFNQIEISEKSLYDMVYRKLSDNGFKLNEEHYAYSLDQGGYLVLMDGFDEVCKEKAEGVFRLIQRFSNKYNKNHFVISSRPSYHFMGWHNFHEIFLCSLTKEQALALISKTEYDIKTKKSFLYALKKGLFEQHKSFASNPLLLTIMLLTFSKYIAFPENINDFYDQAFLTLFYRHDDTKDYFTRKLRCHLSYDDFKIIFSRICFFSYFEEVSKFSEDELLTYIQRASKIVNCPSFSSKEFIEDLTSSVCMLIKDGQNYFFIHRSFQEYFAAWYTGKLSDEDQYIVLTDWMHKTSSCASSEYIKMLFSFQSEKTNKNILCPGIKKLKELYDKFGFSYDFLSEYNSGISIRMIHCIENGQKTSFYSLGLPPETTDIGNYLSNIVSLVCTFNNYTIQNHLRELEAQKSLYNIAKNYINQVENGHRRNFRIIYPTIFNSDNRNDIPEITLCSFADLHKIVDSKQMLRYLEWYRDRIQFCFCLYEKYAKSADSNTKTAAYILANL